MLVAHDPVFEIELVEVDQQVHPAIPGLMRQGVVFSATPRVSLRLRVKTEITH